MPHINAKIPTTLTDADLVLLDQIPKATLYAVAKDLAFRIVGEGREAPARAELLKTWKTLHGNQIVTQKPPNPDMHVFIAESS